MRQQQRLLNILLDDFGLCLCLCCILLKLLQAVIDAIDAEASCIIAWLDDPDVVHAIRPVLGDVPFHLLVTLGHPVHQVE